MHHLRTFFGPALVRRGSLAILVLLSGSAASAPPAPENLPSCESVGSIGTAEMTPDGVIALYVVSIGPGPIAHGALSYPPNHPDYEMIKRHIGAISPGQTKPVPPFCSK